MKLRVNLFCCLLTTFFVQGVHGLDSFAGFRSSSFSVLYSTLGYDSQAEKRVLVRSIEEIDPAGIDVASSVWRLMDDAGHLQASGRLVFLGKTFGIQLWEADFSPFSKEGIYRIQVELNDENGESIGRLRTLEFRIEDRLLSRHILFPLTVENAEARVANAYYGNGYYDCDSHMGENNSHPIFLNALVQTYTYVESSLNAWEKDRFKAAAGRAFDYILSQQSADGTRYQYATRPYVHHMVGSQQAAYGLSVYLNMFKDIDPTRCNKANYDRIVDSITPLEHSDGSESDLRTTDYMASIYYHLYAYSGDEAWKRKAFDSVNSLLTDFNFRKNSSVRGGPLFEGLCLLCRAFPEEAVLPENDWIRRATRIKNQYYAYVRDHNGFKILPVCDPAHLDEEWADMTKMPRGRGTAGMLWNSDKLVSAMDACFLAEVTGDDSIMEVAAGSLNWILGLHPGLQRDALRNPLSSTESNDKQAASFVSNLNARYAVEWTAQRWAFQNDRYMTVKNGFSNRNHPCVNLRRPDLPYDFDYVYDIPDVKGHINAESYIYHDGLLAYLICVFERYYYGEEGLPKPGPDSFRTNLTGWMTSMGDWEHTVDGLHTAAVLDPYHDCAEMTSSEIVRDFSYEADITIGDSGGVPGLLFRANRYDPVHSGKGYVVLLDPGEDEIRLCKLAAPIRYEAETGICYGGAFEFQEFGASSWERVGYLMNAEDGVSIEEVWSQTGGKTKITIGYSNGFDTRTKSLYVNGERVGSVRFPSTRHDWRWYSAVDTEVLLKAGDNTIAIQQDATDEPGTDIDFLEVPRTSAASNRLGSCEQEINPGGTYHLRVDARGSHIRVYFSGKRKPCIDVKDSTFFHGHLGLSLTEGTAVYQDVFAKILPADDGPLPYEAEDGELLAGAQVVPARNASRGNRVGSLHHVGDGVRFFVLVDETGTKEIAIRYSLGSPRPVNYGQLPRDRNSGNQYKSLYVNGAKIGRVDFPPTGGWDDYRSVTVDADLATGSNTIGILTEERDGGAVDIDRIIISR